MSALILCASESIYHKFDNNLESTSYLLRGVMMNNILLMALSTLKKVEEENIVEVKDFNYTETYNAQLEPMVMCMYDQMTKNKAGMDKNDKITVVALLTKDAKNITENFAGKTAYNYYEEKIPEICAGKATMKPIDVDENNPAEGIRKTVDFIRNLEDRGKLWIDTHGGFRDVALVLESVVSLLKVDNIVPDEIFGVRYNDQISDFVNQKSSYYMFEFVSGMNEFINYGRVNILDEYYKAFPNDNLKEVLKAMREISNGTEECNPRHYQKGLDDLGEIIDGISSTDPLMAIFSDYIKKSYGVLLDKKRRTVVDIIERCTQKNLVQQALTILETLMPEEIVKRKILQYDEKYIAQIEKEHQRLKPKYETDEQFIVNAYVSSWDYNGLSVKKNKNKARTRDDDEKSYIEYVCEGGDRGSNDFLGSTNTNNGGCVPVKLGEKNKDAITIDVSTCIDSDDLWQKAGKLMHLHCALKRCRNKFNHCDSNRPSTKIIIEALKKYVYLARGLFKIYDPT